MVSEGMRATAEDMKRRVISRGHIDFNKVVQEIFHRRYVFPLHERTVRT
ncbi:MAG: hypothetical protein ACFFB3_21315 [Candidatus Hodarchaeota archaeon]